MKERFPLQTYLLTVFEVLKGMSTRITHRLARWGRADCGNTILCVMALISVMVLLGGTITNRVLFESRDAFRNLSRVQARYLAEAGIAQAFKEFDNGATYLNALLKGADGIAQTADDGLLSFGASVSLGNGNFSVIITDNDDGDGDSYSDSDYIIQVTSTGSIPVAPGIERTAMSYLQVFPPPNPVGIASAITSAGPIQTSGTLTVDGRDHDLDSFLVYSNGVFGITTAMPTFQQSGNSKVGGTVLGIDNVPKNKNSVNPAVIETNAVINFNTPDQLVEYSEGVLKSIAQSGTSGSQYTTDPSNLTFPLSGVTYVELPSGVPWNAIDFGNSSGILVVHNATTDAVVKNLNTGTFSGLIIADDMVHIHSDILGAVVTLTPNPSDGNSIGNGSGSVLYSSEAIETITQVSIGPTVLHKSWF